MTPTWYDLLDVAPDASADEIRCAWKSAIADLDPSDRRFRTLNEAAEVLLDKPQRSAYDKTLDRHETRARTQAETPTELDARRATHAPLTSRSRPNVPTWLLASLAVVVALLLSAAGYLVAQPSDGDVADGTSQAQSQAEHAATTILAYDYRHLDADQKAAEALMTTSYEKRYDQLYSVIKQNAPGLQAVVTAQVVASGIVRSGGDRVQVLVFVNRPTTNKQAAQPTIYRDQVVMTMEKSGDDWLVAGMDTNQLDG